MVNHKEKNYRFFKNFPVEIYNELLKKSSCLMKEDIDVNDVNDVNGVNDIYDDNDDKDVPRLCSPSDPGLHSIGVDVHRSRDHAAGIFPSG